jgi:hypothetical protein
MIYTPSAADKYIVGSARYNINLAVNENDIYIYILFNDDYHPMTQLTISCVTLGSRPQNDLTSMY